MIRLEKVSLPEFGGGEEAPPVSSAAYESRLQAVTERMRREGLHFLTVYADREHFANLAYLTGLDPRFEEALLLLDARGRRLLLVGNEGLGYLPDPALRCETVLFQEFSLLGQPRDRSAPLRKILSGFGIGPGVRIGSAGWKYFEGPNVEGGSLALEVPSYLADLLRDLAGSREAVCNATALFMNPADGLRASNSADEIARFEFASVRTSESMLAALRSLAEDVTERDFARHYDGGGLPCSCHPMASFGEKVKRGLSSPSSNRARRGDDFTAAFGVYGALTARAGLVARGPEDLAPALREFFPRFGAGYVEVVAAWYEHVKVGAVSGAVFAAVEARRDPSLFDFAVNPGHLIHLDEWVHSPFAAGSAVLLRSGMALQMDIIPISRGPFCYVNAEDGIVLADDALRAELAARYPDCYARIEARRNFMRASLGMRVDESVLPLSNMPGWLPPYALDLGRAFVQR